MRQAAIDSEFAMRHPNYTKRDLTPEEVGANLRAHGAPESIVKRAVERAEKRAGKMGYSRKVSVQPQAAAGQPHSLEARVNQMLALLRKTANTVGRDLSHDEASSLLAGQRDTSPTYQSDPDHTCANPGRCYHCMGEHMRAAHEFAEVAFSLIDGVDDMLSAWPGANDGELPESEEDSLRAMTPKAKARAHNAFRRMHRDSHRMLGEACKAMGAARSAVGFISARD